MGSPKTGIFVLAVAAGISIAGALLGWQISHESKPVATGAPVPASAPALDHLRATYDPIHFQPAIATATDAQCLACHKEVLEDKVRDTSPAGVKAASSKAWYQQLTTYVGDQDTFHRRHLTTPMAKELMNLSCNTCHQGHDPRDEAPGSSATGAAQTTTDFNLRKQVNVEATCLKCHGKMNTEVMGLPAPWSESKEMFGNNCLTCHSAIRTNRHQVNYLKADAIEAAGQKNSDVCYGCHGGRAWYRTHYPYPRHTWEGASPDTPDWAKDRPTESEERFRLKTASKK